MTNTLNNRTTLGPSTNRPLDQPAKQAWGLVSPFSRLAVSAALVALLILGAVAGIWPLSVPPPLPAQVAPDAFSVERAVADLEVITAQARVPGTPGYLEARAYLAEQFAAIGLTPEFSDAIITQQESELGVGVVAQAHNLVVRVPGTDSTGAIVVAGHLDSVHTTTAASDCGGCAVSVLEVARALVAGTALRNDVIFLIEDGEETTRSGALAFVEQHPWAQDVRVAINQEAMGTGGASLLYVTGPENGWLIPQALKAMPSAVAYSFANDLIWFSGTGGSDLDQLLMVAPVGLGLAYVGNVPPYHTAQDSVQNLDLRTLQHRGTQTLALVRHFANLSLDGPLNAPNVVYFTLVNQLTVNYPTWVGMTLSLLAALGFGLLLVSGMRRGSVRGRDVGLGALVLLPLVMVASAMSGALWYLIRLLDMRLQVFLIGVSYDRPWYTLAFVLLTGGLVVAGFALFRRAHWSSMTMGVLAWWIVLAMFAAWLVPGSSPIFAVPALLTLLPLTWIVLGRSTSSSIVYFVLLGVAAAGTLLVVAPALNFLGIFSGRAELLMNLPMIALLPAPLAGLLAALLLPVWEALSQPRRWLVPAALVTLSLIILIGVGQTASFTPARPKPNMVAYVMEDGQAQWVTVANKMSAPASLLDEWTAQFFPSGPIAATFNPFGAYYMGEAYEFPAYAGPAPLAEFPPPALEIVEEFQSAEGLRQIEARLVLNQPSPLQILRLESDDGIAQVRVLGKELDALANAAQPTQRLWLELHGVEASAIDLMITVAGSGSVRLQVEERLYHLPDLADVEIAPRPPYMMPSPTFITDSSLVRTEFVLP